jgi:hypothetical protein
VWSVGGTCDADSRKKFDQFLRNKIKEDKVIKKAYNSRAYNGLKIIDKPDLSMTDNGQNLMPDIY